MDEMTLPNELPCDGERFIPEKMVGVIALEHWHRYLFAAQYVTGKDVLDIASGEGYGSARLASVARTVIGVDICSDAVAHARATYKLNNLEYLLGNCEAIPLDDHSIDVVVSFETIEHLENHRAMMAEIKRVLRPDGLLIISSPNKDEYSDIPGYSNPFHLKELYGHEFKEILANNFSNIAIYGQRVLSGSLIEGDLAIGGLDYHDIDDLDSIKTNYLTNPLYFIAFASDRDLPKPSASILEKNFEALHAEINDFRNPGLAKIIHALAWRESSALQEALRSDWYLEQNPDLIQARVDPVVHWFTTGFAEGRIPSSDSTQLVKKIIDERQQAVKAEQVLLLEEIERMARKRPVDLRKFEAEIVRTKLRARYEIEAMGRQLLQREEESRAQMLQLHREAEARQTEQKQSAQQNLEILAQQHRTQEEQLRADMARREIELSGVLREALERQRAQEFELVRVREEAARVREDAQAEISAQLHALAEREQAFSKQVMQMHTESEAREAELKQSARQDLEILAQRYGTQEEQLRAEMAKRESELSGLLREALERQQVQESELVRVREETQAEISAQLQNSAERERAFSEQVTQLHTESEAREAELKRSARQDLDTLAQRHRTQEEQLRAEMSRRESELSDLLKEALERQRVQEVELAQARLEARNEIEAQLHKLAERERVFSAQIVQLHREAEAQRTALQQAAQQDLDYLAQQHSKQDEWLRAEITQLKGELRSLEQKMVEQQMAMEAELNAIYATRSWRWTSLFRQIKF